MERPLEGTVALVTGASSGIGEKTAAALSAAGALVAVVARRGDRLRALARSLGEERTLPIEADVTEEPAAAAIVAQTVERFGRLDILVNNAGVMLLGPILGAPVEEWQRMLDLNLSALLRCTHAALPHLLHAAESAPRRVADVVNVSSVAGRVARSGSGVYNATKWGVNAFSESLRQEVTRRHVRVALVEPGAVATELAGHNRAEVQESIRKRFEGTEMLQAEEIADAIRYVVTRARHVAVNEMLIRPTGQGGVGAGAARVLESWAEATSATAASRLAIREGPPGRRAGSERRTERASRWDHGVGSPVPSFVRRRVAATSVGRSRASRAIISPLRRSRG